MEAATNAAELSTIPMDGLIIQNAKGWRPVGIPEQLRIPRQADPIYQPRQDGKLHKQCWIFSPVQYGHI